MFQQHDEMRELISQSQSISSAEKPKSSAAKPVVPILDIPSVKSGSKAPKLHAAPQGPTAAEKEKEVDIKKAVKARHRIMINEYIDSKVFGEKLRERGFEKIDIKKAEKMSLEEMKVILDEVRIACMSDGKKEFVNNMMNHGMNFLSTILVATTHQQEFARLSLVMREHPEVFEPELEEIAIELDPSWVPGAKQRLGLKIASIISTIYTQTQMYKDTHAPQEPEVSKNDINKQT